MAAKYARTGWLERLGLALYRLPGGRFDRDQSLLVLREAIDGLHVGGKPALAWQGVRHNMSPVEMLTLWSDRRVALPVWFVRERALLELLRDAGQQQDLEAAHHLFMIAQGLRLQVLGR